MKINSVKFKDKASFEKNKKKKNVVEVHEPFGIIVFQDEEPVEQDANKVFGQEEVSSDLSAIPTGLAIVKTRNHKKAIEYLERNGIVISEDFEATSSLIVEIPAFTDFDSFKMSIDTPFILSVEQDLITKGVMMSDAYTYAGQWHLGNMKAAEAWAMLPDAIGDVAVLDISCDINHEDLVGATNANWNCVTDTEDVTPKSPYEKHGTSCTGIIAARTNNGIGVSSLGNNKLRVQFLNIGYNSTSTGSFSTSDTILTRAVNKAIANPMCLAITMSFGSSGYMSSFASALQVASTTGRGGKGIPCFASSGNSSISEFTQYPASYPSVMAIGASTTQNLRASFSNYGTRLFAAAPGTNVLTTDRMGADGYNATNYNGFSGTSAASPVFAAAAAACLLKNPLLTVAELKVVLSSSCRKTGGYVYTNGKSLELGYGVIDMAAAVTASTGTIVVPPPPPPTPVNVDITSSISVSSNVTVGVSTQSVVTLTMNQEPTFPNVAVPIKIYLNTGVNSVVSTSSLQLAVSSINLGSTVYTASRTIGFTVPATYPAGQYTIVCVADPSNAIAEISETNNIGSQVINVVSAPVDPTLPELDMSVEMKSFSWTDGKLRVTYEVKNTGITPITSFTLVRGFDGATQSTSVMTQPLASGKKITSTTSWPAGWIPALPATYRATITMVNGISGDGNLTNNTSTILIS